MVYLVSDKNKSTTYYVFKRALSQINHLKLYLPFYSVNDGLDAFKDVQAFYNSIRVIKHVSVVFFVVQNIIHIFPWSCIVDKMLVCLHF